jgi:molecular chaperone GrpE
VTESGDQPLFRDRRRIDPETGELREPQSAAAPGGTGAADTESTDTESTGTESTGTEPRDPQPAADQHVDASMDPDVQSTTGAGADAAPDRVSELEASLAERTLDLQRLQAEYVNYKRRVDRDREMVRESANAGVLTALLPVLDDIDRAREHGELEGGFKAVADALGRTVEGLGLVRFGEPGDAFDPRVHEALMHDHAEGIDGPTCTKILQPGYRVGERVLRPARVAVAEPSTDPAGAPVDTPGARAPDEAAGGNGAEPPR